MPDDTEVAALLKHVRELIDALESLLARDAIPRPMTEGSVAILNSLVTFAAENIPGGLSDDEAEVARIIGKAALKGRA